MRIRILLAGALLLAAQTAPAQINLDKLFGKKSGGGGLSNEEVIRGLKEALSVGSNKASEQASRTDGYFRNPRIKIPFPPEAAKMESTLRSMGMGKEVDRFVLSLNRAAEDAARKAAPVFADAIRGMTVKDGLQILNGGDDAATRYLEKTTSEKLRTQFRPVVKASIDKVEVTRYWSPLAGAYNKVPFVKPVNPDLEAYVTQKALDGLFFLVAEEEARIRKDPAARVTDLLKKVFGR